MSNTNIDVNSIVGDDFSDLSPEDMALLTGRGSDAAPQSPSIAFSFDVTVSFAMSVAAYLHVNGTCKKH